MNFRQMPAKKRVMIWLGLLTVLALFGACTAASAPAEIVIDETTATEMDSPLNGDGSPVTAIRYSPDGQMVISGHENGALQVWDANGVAQSALNGHKGMVVDVATSPDGQLVASIGGDKRTLLQARDGDDVNELEVALARANTVDFNSDGDQLAVGFWEKLELWSLADLDAGPALVEDLEPSMSLAYFMPDGASLIVALSNVGLAQSALMRVDPDDSRVLQTLHPDAPAHLLVTSPDSVQMATAARENVQIWCVDCDSALKSLDIAGVTAMAFGPDGETLLTLQPGVATVWDLSSNAPLSTTEVTADGDIAAFAPNGNTLAIGLAVGSVEIVELATE